MTSEIESLKVRFEEELTRLKQLEKDKEKNISNRQQLEGQLTENNLVKTELDLLETDAKVFKLIGPVLVRQDVAEARQNVDKRIAYITTEITRLEATMADSAVKLSAQKDNLTKMQNALKQMFTAAGAH